MPRVSFGGPKPARNYDPIPEGRYLSTIKDIEETTTRKGDPMWKLRLQIEEGEHAGRLVFDRIVFSQRAQERLQMFCRALGLPTKGEIDLQPEMVEGKSCVVVVETEDYEDNEGLTRTGNKVAFECYLPVARPDQTEAEDASDLPF